MSPRVVIDGVALDALHQAEVVDHVLGEIDRGGPGGLIITANADIMRQLRTPARRELAERAALVVADGMPIVWASRLMERPLPERVNGTNLLWELSAGAAPRGRRIYLLGAAPGVAVDAAEALVARARGLEVCGVSSPPPGFDLDPAQWASMVAEVTRARPDLVFVALGHPRQEQVALRLSEQLPRAWFVGCGGALDLIAGRIPRAPVLLQRLGAEWLHRLWQEPRRLVRRYLVDDVPYVLGMLWRAWRSRDRSGREVAPQ